MIAKFLTIAGTDPSGGAGIQADIKTFSALGAYAASVITAVVAQNTQGVRSFVALDPAFVADQIDAVLDDVRIDAVKIGMVANAGIAEVIASRLRHHGVKNIVLDPVMVAKSGHHLLDPDAVAAVRDLLVPLSTVITPNLPEAGVLLGLPPQWTLAEMHARMADLHRLGPQWVLLKGGHLGGTENSTDLLHDGRDTIEFSAPRLETKNDHGTGCTLSAAIAALLPTQPVEHSVRHAKSYMHGALAASGELDVGQGHGPLHHFYRLWGQASDDNDRSTPVPEGRSLQHRISVGALVMRDNKLLLARHSIPGRYDFWAPPGGRVEGEEELGAAAERETFEETGIRAQARRMAYIDELIDDSGRMVKFWFLADYLSGEIDIHANPVAHERIVDAGWFEPGTLPSGHVFPAVLRDEFWEELPKGFLMPKKLPLMKSIF